jgi:hypothetical protein
MGKYDIRYSKALHQNMEWLYLYIEGVNDFYGTWMEWEK